MADKIHVLLVEHEKKDHDEIRNMMQYFSYEVTSVRLASTALSILSKEKVQFDLVIANMYSPDSFSFQLLQVAMKMDLLVTLMSNDDHALTNMRALEQGAFICVRKPVTMQTLGCLWQHVSREKIRELKEKEQSAELIMHNLQAKEFGEEDLVEGHGNNNNNAEEKPKSKEKVKFGTPEHDRVVFSRKVWIEWTAELHGKFMDAIEQLGPGRCYPKDILEIMNVPGLTRLQVASHLQKCRNAKWIHPDKRRPKQANTKTTAQGKRPLKSKTVRFGSMPFADDNSQFHGAIHQEFAFDPQTNSTMPGHDRIESSNNGYHLGCLLGYGINPFAQGINGAFNIGQVGHETFGVDDYGGQGAFDLPTADPMVQSFSDFQQELGVDYNGSWQSLLLEQDDNHQISASTNAIDQWIYEALSSVDDAEIEG